MLIFKQNITNEKAPKILIQFLVYTLNTDSWLII